MPATDGSLIFNTKIDTSGMEKDAKGVSSKVVDLRNKVSSTAAAVKNLRDELEKTGDTKVKTKATEKVESDIEKTDAKLVELRKKAIGMYDFKVSELRSTGITSGVEEAAERALEADDEYKKLISTIEKTSDALVRYENELTKANDSAPLTKDTAEYKKKEQRLSELTGQLEVYKAKLSEAEQEEQQTAAQTGNVSRKTNNYRQYIKQTVTALRMFVTGLGKAYNALKKTFSNTIGRAIKSISSKFSSANSSLNILSSTLTRIKSLIRSVLLYKITSNWYDTIKDGLGEISKISPKVNKNLSDLKTSFTYLKNSLSALAAPLLNVITPALVNFMDVISNLTEKLTKLTAILSGQSTYTKAVKVQEDYAASLDDTTDSITDNTAAVKENQKNLAGYDELNVMSDDSSDDDSTSSQSVQPMFENVTAQVDGIEKTLLDALKRQDFISIGRLISDKLNTALDSVKWSNIGTKISEYFGNALEFAYGLVSGFDFAKLGDSIGALINSALSYYNSSLLGKTLSEFISGFINALSSLISTVDWSKVSSNIIGFISNFDFADISRMAVKLINSFTSAIQKTDFKGIGNAFANGLSKIKWEKIWDSTATLFTSALKGVTDFFGLKGVDSSKLTSALKSIKTPLSDIFNSVKDMAKSVLPAVVNDLLPAVVDFIGDFMRGLKPIISNLSPILKTVTKDLSRVIKALSPVISRIGEVIGTIIDTLEPVLTPILNLITKVVEILSPALNGILWVVEQIFNVLSPINELIGGIIGLLIGDNEPTISEKFQGELDNLNTISEQMSTVSDNIDNAISNVNESLSQTSGDLQYIDDLRDRMVELIEKSTLTSDEMNELQTIADLISEKVPEFKTAWDEMTAKDDAGKISFNLNKEEMVSSIDTVIDKLKEQYATEALQEAYKQLYSDKVKNNQDIAAATDEVSKAQNLLNEKTEAYEQALKRQEEAEKELTKGTFAGSINDVYEATENAQFEMDKYAENLDTATTNLLAAKGRHEELNTELDTLSNTLDVVSGKYDEHNVNLQALRDAYDKGFIDIDEIKNTYKIGEKELFDGSKSMADQSVAGYKKGIALGALELKNAGMDFGSDVLKGAYESLGINSPSKEFEEAADYSIQGYDRGIVKNMKTAISRIAEMADKLVEAMRNGLKPFETMFDFIPEVVKSILNYTIDLFQQFTNSIVDDINYLSNGIGTVNLTSGSKNVTMPQMEHITLPRLATGTVVPANYGEFLAVLGDNKREPEVVSPVSSMKQAFLEALAEVGYNGGSDRPIYCTVVLEDGTALFRSVAEEDDRYFKSHGNSRFDRRQST